MLYEFERVMFPSLGQLWTAMTLQEPWLVALLALEGLLLVMLLVFRQSTKFQGVSLLAAGEFVLL